MIRLDLEIIDYASETEEEIAEKAVELLKTYRAEIPLKAINKTVYQSNDETDILVEELIEQKFKPIKQEVTKLAEAELTKIQEVTTDILAKLQEFKETLQHTHKETEETLQYTHKETEDSVDNTKDIEIENTEGEDQHVKNGWY